jgi:choline kinase
MEAIINKIQKVDIVFFASPVYVNNVSGEMNVCFISNNDITGGNSGSAMFNARGELLGLAFDGNWEAMSSDILYEPKMQRCIGVDVRYILFMIEKYGKAGDLIRELKIVSGK